MKFFLLLTLTIHTLFALTSIAPVEIGKKPGIHGNMALSLETKKGNTNKENYKASAYIAYDNNISYVTWAEISGEYGKSNDVEDTNKLYLHLRYIHALTQEKIRYELFGQMEEDQFRLIKNRSLVGAGLRFRIFQLFSNGNGYLGLGGFGESIRYTSDEAQEENVRLNSYFAYTMTPTEESRLTYTLYFQPKLNDFTDYVNSHKIELELLIYKQLFLNFKVAYDIDTKPAIGVEESDFTQTTSFLWKF